MGDILRRRAAARALPAHRLPRRDGHDHPGRRRGRGARADTAGGARRARHARLRRDQRTRLARGIRAAYFQALAASTNGPGLQRSGTLDLAQLLAQSRVPASLVTASTHLLAPLIEYDERYGTDYLSTLRAYLQHDRKVVRVAEVFFMHRNTIRYRLNQIAEILKTDIDSTRTLVNLTIAMQLHEAGFTPQGGRFTT
ncbi:PucR family transcriptional regulator [Leucobacter soli]|uniref:PucR family transcriptional regulator n=1 Tax=Leucobacter soli TaxID=2812850 RepID=UPI0036103F1F